MQQAVNHCTTKYW